MGGRGTARDFDFWIGEWDVFGPQGRQVGTNSITPLLDGAALAEHWRGAGGVEGHSINAYDEAAQCWRVTVERAGVPVVLKPKQLVLATGGALSSPRVPALPGESGSR